ncbi:hypothetical protein [Lacinutrix sp.]|uniref:hypothetical protein n=1 Tax=Lacinutrix sp. TaxID=1937692 RepID=UPI0025C12A3D|nr:hypothetical protein [Lacinutrix sp.]
MRYLITLLLITNFSFGQEWITTELTEFASIKFPYKPDKTILKGVNYYSSWDDMGEYVVMVQDIGNPRITESELPGFYQGVISGSLASANGELLEQTEFEYKGIKGVEILYTIKSNPQLHDSRHKMIFIVNNHVLSYEFSTYKKNAKLASTNKNKFFYSISLVAEKEIEPEKKESNSAIESGFTVGQLFFYLLIIVLFIGSIIVIRNQNSKKKKNVE